MDKAKIDEAYQALAGRTGDLFFRKEYLEAELKAVQVQLADCSSERAKLHQVWASQQGDAERALRGVPAAGDMSPPKAGG